MNGQWCMHGGGSSGGGGSAGGTLGKVEHSVQPSQPFQLHSCGHEWVLRAQKGLQGGAAAATPPSRRDTASIYRASYAA